MNTYRPDLNAIDRALERRRQETIRRASPTTLAAVTRYNDPQTSKDAADEVNSSDITGRRVQQILALLREHPAGLIGAEIARRLDVEVAWISSLLTRMERNGLLRHNGKRLNPESGKKQMVWAIA